MGAYCCVFIFRFNRYLLEYSAFFCFLIAPRLVSAILVVQDVNAILRHTYNTAVRAQLIVQRHDGCMVHPPPPPHSAPTHVNPRCDDITNLTVDGVKRFTPAVRHIHVKMNIRPTLEQTQPPVQWVSEVITPCQGRGCSIMSTT